ncbi:MAG: trypsin-like peptidase domain-containing protein [Alphaproteobacteria bacterium]|nr:trypsin-like peptidase domain-containing protein [Alphaproteobacteria bacterium]
MDEDSKKLLEELRQDMKRVLKELGSLRGVTGVVSAIVSAIVAGAVVALLAGCAAYPQPAEPSAAGVSGFVVGLVDEGGRAFCTGTNTEVGVVTAAHCVDPETDTVRVGTLWGLDEDRSRWSTVHPLRVLAVDRVADIAVLQRLPRRLAPAARVRPEPPVLGERVIVVGHGASIPYTAHTGTVGRAAGPCMPGWGCRGWFDVDVRATPGNSGSGILDAQGRLIGVLSFGVGPNITGAIPAALIPSPDR